MEWLICCFHIINPYSLRSRFAINLKQCERVVDIPSILYSFFLFFFCSSAWLYHNLCARLAVDLSDREKLFVSRFGELCLVILVGGLVGWLAGWLAGLEETDGGDLWRRTFV